MFYLLKMIFGKQGYFTVYVDDEQPITKSKKIVLFESEDLSQKAILFSDYDGVIKDNYYGTLDFPAALESIRSKDKSDDDNLLNCINTLIDCLKAIDVPIPPNYKSSLEALANRLTFEMYYSDLVKGKARLETVNAFQWGLTQVRKNVTVLK